MHMCTHAYTHVHVNTHTHTPLMRLSDETGSKAPALLEHSEKLTGRPRPLSLLAAQQGAVGAAVDTMMVMMTTMMTG